MSDANNALVRPRPLRQGDRVAVLAASSPSRPDRIDIARSYLESRGLHVTLAPNLYDVERTYLAGPDERRIEQLNHYLRDDSFDGFFFARGGYGAMRLLDRIDYDAVRQNPRPVVGYSDLTALHQAFARHAGVGSFHGPMLNLDFHNQLSPEIERWFWDVLAGESPLTWNLSALRVLSPGRARGRLFGGCLSLITSLLGTPYDYWIDGGIWFWEDVDEPTYRIDRMLTHLRLSGRLQTIEGLMIGRLKDCGGKDPSELDRLLQETFSAAGIPVVRDLPFGHFGDNLLLPIGTLAELDTARGLTLLEPAVDASLERSR